MILIILFKRIQKYIWINLVLTEFCQERLKFNFWLVKVNIIFYTDLFEFIFIFIIYEIFIEYFSEEKAWNMKIYITQILESLRS